MTHVAITFKTVVLTAFAIALAILISIGAVQLTGKHPVPIDRRADASIGGIAESPNPDWRLSRVNLLLSGMK